MRYVLAILGAALFVMVAAPSVRAAPAALDQAVQTLADQELAYMKKGGWKGWKGKKAKWRRGPPPWAPAWGRRAKHRY